MRVSMRWPRRSRCASCPAPSSTRAAARSASAIRASSRSSKYPPHAITRGFVLTTLLPQPAALAQLAESGVGSEADPAQLRQIVERDRPHSEGRRSAGHDPPGRRCRRDSGPARSRLRAVAPFAAAGQARAARRRHRRRRFPLQQLPRQRRQPRIRPARIRLAARRRRSDQRAGQVRARSRAGADAGRARRAELRVPDRAAARCSRRPAR